MNKIIPSIILSLFLFGCIDTYSETDEIARKTWPLMTSQEKIIYEKVHNAWGQKPLQYLREAIRKRALSPDEDVLPFKDVAKVVKTINNAFTYSSNDNDIAKAAKDKGRFNVVDEKWYRKLLNEIDGYVQRKHEKVIKLLPTIEKEEQTEWNENLLIEKVEEEIVKSLEPLTEDEIFEIEMIISRCQKAIEIVHSVADKNNPLTKADESDIIYEISICETKRLSEKLIN